MSDVSFSCDADQGISFSAGRTTPVGYLTHVKIGDHEFKEMTKYRSPEKDHINAVGVLRGVHWAGGAMDPITMGAYVHREIAKVVADLRDDPNKLSDIKVKIGWKTFRHGTNGQGKGQYFEYFWTEKEIDAIVHTTDGEIALTSEVGDEEVYKAVYYPFSIRIDPDPHKVATLHLQRTITSKRAQSWGNQTKK
jgi:hypothetical protein